MGFPVGYSELVLPKQLLYLLLLLGYIRRFLLWAFDAVGLGDLLDLADDYHQAMLEQDHQYRLHRHGGGDAQGPRDHHHHGALPHQAAAAMPMQQHHHHHHRRPEFRAVPALVIEEVLPVVRFDELEAATRVGGGDTDCAVCLSGIAARDEVRRLGNCRHVFHRACLDRWMLEHDQRTCPLCRAPLIADEMAGALWACAAGVPDASDFDFSYFGAAQVPLPLTAPVPPSPTATLLRPHELLLSGLGGYQ